MGVKGYGSISISIVEDGVGISSRYSEYYLSTSSSELSGGSWSESIPDYIAGRYYWVREVTNWTDGTTTRGNPMYDRATTDLFIRSLFGLAMKINHSAFSTTSSGRAYLHGYDDGDAADVNGYIIFNGIKRNVTRGQIYPGNRVPYNRYIYIVLRLTAATATSGTTYLVWYNSGWKYAGLTSGSAATWTWNNTRDVALGQFILPGANSDLVEAYLYNPVRSAESVQTTSSSPYQYSQSAVEWYNANGSTTVDATTMLAAWADGAFSATTKIDGGFIKAHTIQSEHLATNAIMSNNFQASSESSSPFSVTGTYLDLTNGNLYSPNFGIDNTYGVAYLNGEIIATSGRIGNSAATNYWEIGTKTDYNAQQSAALIGHGTSYIQSGDWQISNNRIDTRMYDAQNKITYLNNNNTYWDFGMQVPELDTTATGYVSGISNNWLYIRKHANTIPTLETDWNYIFRIDETGMIYINGKSLDEKYASIDGVSGEYLPRSGGTITGDLTVNGTLNATANKAKQLTHSLTVNGTAWDGSSNTTIGTMGVAYGGTGATTFTSGQVLIGNGQNAIQTRAITNNTSATYITGSTNLITANTLKFFNGSYNSSHNSNIEYVKLGKLGDVVTHNYDEFITTSGGIIDGTLQATGLTTETLTVTDTATFTGGLSGDLTGNADTADRVNHDLIIKLNSGTTEGTNMFTFNGSAAKTVNVTKSAIGLGNVENTALSTWAGSTNLTMTKVGTLAGAAVKAVDTSISASSTSTNLPTSAAVASFVEGKGYVTSSGVTSITLSAGAGISLSATSAITTTGTRTITNSGVRAISESTANGKISVNTNGTVADVAVHGVNKTVTTLASNDAGKLVLTYLDGTTSDPIEVKIIGQSGSSVSYADALNVNGTAVGSVSQPVFINAQGKPQTANTIPSVTLNGSATTSPSFYAPTAVGTSGQVLKSNGSGAPSWVNQSTLSVGSATTATKFSSARSITLTGDTTGTASADGSSGWSIATKTDRLTTVGDNRSVATKPNDYANKIIFQGLKGNGYINSPSTDTYSYLVGLRGWSDSSRGNSHEIAFNNSGIFRRTGATTDWGAWAKLVDSANYTDYTVKKDGTGASGSWGISVTGTASNVTGTVTVANGGTGKTTGRDAANYFLNSLDTGSSTPVDGDYYISQYVSGGTTTTTYHRRPMSALWSYINSKTNAVYAKLSGATFTGAVTGTSFGASSYMSVNTSNSSTTGGLALYGTAPTSYGIAMRGTGNGGKHGFVQGDWGIYTYMSGADNRGWVFKNATKATNVASISNLGEAVFNGSVTVGGNTTNDSGCRMEFDENLQCLSFVFN